MKTAKRELVLHEILLRDGQGLYIVATKNSWVLNAGIGSQLEDIFCNPIPQYLARHILKHGQRGLISEAMIRDAEKCICDRQAAYRRIHNKHISKMLVAEILFVEYRPDALR